MANGVDESWEVLGSLEDLLFFVSSVRSSSALGVVSVDWTGCGACSLGSPYLDLRSSLPGRYSQHGDKVRYGLLEWRKDTAFDFSEVVSKPYQALLYLTRTKTQLFGGQRPVETFTNLDVPVYWRPKFPQLFLLNGQAIDETKVNALIDAEQSEALSHPWLGDFKTNHLDWHAGIDDGELVLRGPRVLSGDLRLGDQAVRDNLGSCLRPRESVLLQITNYSLYRTDGDDPDLFVSGETLQSCDSVVDHFIRGDFGAYDFLYYDRRNAPI